MFSGSPVPVRLVISLWRVTCASRLLVAAWVDNSFPADFWVLCRAILNLNPAIFWAENQIILSVPSIYHWLLC